MDSESSSSESGPAPRRLPAIAWGAILGVAALALDVIPLPLLGPDFPPLRLGPIAVFVAFIEWGTGPGLVAALGLVAAASGGGFGDPATTCARLLETWLVAQIGRRSESLVLSMALYWIVLGSIIAGLGSLGWLGLNRTAAGVLIASHGFSGLVTALGADAILELLARHERSKHRARPLGSYMRTRFTWTVLAPTLALTLLSARVVRGAQADAAAAVPSLLFLLASALLASILVPVAATRLARTLSRPLARIEVLAENIETDQLTLDRFIEDLAASPITEVRRLGEHFSGVLKAVAHYDPLTGLPNRKLMTDRLVVACAQALARRENFALLYVDLDRFRVVDHSLGHALGNELLRRVAHRLKDCVGPADTVARVEGDEFALLIPGMSRMEDATDTARRVMEAVKRPSVLAGREVFVTASVGISFYPRDGHDAETILKNAHAATYVAKEKGQDSYRRYTARITARDAQRLTIESGLRHALEEGGFLVHYQPIVGLVTGEVLAAEALVRWNRPEIGVVAACEFISVAEASGLIAPIGHWVLQQACMAALGWSRAGHAVRVAVNLSARQFQQPDLVDEVGLVLKQTGLDPALLELEITESGAMQDVERSVTNLERLRKLGVSIAVDDFGTGYSSLSYLKRLPLDRVKLDQSFVRDLTTSSDDAAIATAVIAMAHSLGLEVVAEGVETQEQLAFLREQGCDALQGYVFSPPASAEEIKQLLAQGVCLPVTARTD